MISDQDKELADLKAQIEAKKAAVLLLDTQMLEDNKDNVIEERDNRKLAKDNAASGAQLKFIQEKYDFNSNVRNLRPDEFTELENTNNEVRTSIHTNRLSRPSPPSKSDSRTCAESSRPWRTTCGPTASTDSVL